MNNEETSDIDPIVNNQSLSIALDDWYCNISHHHRAAYLFIGDRVRLHNTLNNAGFQIVRTKELEELRKNNEGLQLATVKEINKLKDEIQDFKDIRDRQWTKIGALKKDVEFYKTYQWEKDQLEIRIKELNQKINQLAFENGQARTESRIVAADNIRLIKKNNLLVLKDDRELKSAPAEPRQRKSFREELEIFINQQGADAVTNTPDYILASFLAGCLDLFDKATRSRDKHLESSKTKTNDRL